MISVIVPIYNVEQYLRRALDSILSQTHKDWEAILVDDGSTDASGRIAEEYEQCDHRFKVIHKPNGGVSTARMEAFNDQYDQAFGEQARISAVNIASPKQFEVKTPSVVIKINSGRTDLVETRMIDGHSYILIRADEGVEVNGVSVTV